MERPFLFLAGEYVVSMPIVFSKDNWGHSMSSIHLDYDLKLHRRNRIEDIKGIILFADLNNKQMEEHNLNSIITSKIPCYPDPNVLLDYMNRHCLHRKLIRIPGADNNPNDYIYECGHHGIAGSCGSCRKLNIEHIPMILESRLKKHTKLVLKTGLNHRGENKYLLSNIEDFNQVGVSEKKYTLGPYYEGDSVRVLFVNDKVFVFEIQNDQSWIKNTEGASIVLYNESDYDKRLVEHALKVKQNLRLDVVGVDYIVNKTDNKIYFLEANYFPGLNVSDECVDYAKQFFLKKMKEIEDSVV